MDHGRGFVWMSAKSFQHVRNLCEQLARTSSICKVNFLHVMNMCGVRVKLHINTWAVRENSSLISMLFLRDLLRSQKNFEDANGRVSCEIAEPLERFC